jgi:hypothetical protein
MLLSFLAGKTDESAMGAMEQCIGIKYGTSSDQMREAWSMYIFDTGFNEAGLMLEMVDEPNAATAGYCWLLLLLMLDRGRRSAQGLGGRAS